MIASIALLEKIKNIKCNVSKKRKRNMCNFASTIKSKHEYKILPRSKPKVLQRKTELSRYVLWNFSSIRNSSGKQNAKIHSSFSRHVRPMRADGGWLRQSYINAVTQVFYVKKNRRDNRIHQSHRVFEKHEKKYDQN